MNASEYRNFLENSTLAEIESKLKNGELELERASKLAAIFLTIFPEDSSLEELYESLLFFKKQAPELSRTTSSAVAMYKTKTALKK